jgi:predicted dithiol-disulfide oxidoreductase (DUF899 family)
MGAQQTDLETRLRELDQEIRSKRQEYVALSKQLCGETIGDYTLKTHDGNMASISDLFGDKDDLILIHNMGQGCAYCTLWADGFNHLTPHLENRAAFVIVSPDSPQAQSEFRASRNWQFEMVSAEGTNFIEDMGFRFKEGDDAYWMPGVSIFKKSADGQITRVSKDFFGPGDMYSSPWHFFDLLSDGANDWQPAFNY